MTKRCLCFSDVHLGHHRTKTDEIIFNLKSAIHYYSDLDNIDVIFIAGDLFDRLLTLKDPQVNSIMSWATRFLKLCESKDISIRILEGTPSHDWKQSLSLITLADNLGLKLDIKYHNTVVIEYMEKLGMNVLFIPDEWGITSEYTLNHVKNLMKSMNLEKVDLAMMHGMFDYQIGNLPNIPFMKSVHSSVEYLNLVNHYILIGHVHTFSFFERILAEGSFDRISHGEEEPKGFIAFNLEDNPKDDTFFFIENKNSKRYESIHLKNEDLTLSLKQIGKFIKKLPSGSHVRVILTKTHPLNTIWENQFSCDTDYHFSKKVFEKTLLTDKDKLELQDRVRYEGITITHDNLKELVSERINSNMNYDIKSKSEAIRILNNYI
jgi:DNA repair exonuclease SbcCD nuclease subunit